MKESKELRAANAQKYYSDNLEEAINQVVNSRLSEKKIIKILKLRGTKKEVIQEVVEEVRKRRGV